MPGDWTGHDRTAARQVLRVGFCLESAPVSVVEGKKPCSLGVRVRGGRRGAFGLRAFDLGV